MNSDLGSFDGWFKMSMKFPGICLKCKKKINLGEMGYWSRKKKSVLHEKCYEQVFKILEGQRMRTPVVLKNKRCYICQSKIDFDTEPISSLMNLNSEVEDDVMFCSICLTNFNLDIYNQYKKIIREQI